MVHLVAFMVLVSMNDCFHLSLSCSFQVVQSSRRLEGVDFCSIGCVLATKFCGEARIHVFSKTQKLFLEIPPRDDLIKIINFLLMVLKSILRKSG